MTAITISLAMDFFFLMPLLMKVDGKTFETAVTDSGFDTVPVTAGSGG